MTTQKRNDEMVNLLRPDFFARSEPNASMVHYQGAIMSTCGLSGFWPMGPITSTPAGIFARDVACGYDLTATATPTFGYLYSATVTSLPPWVNFVAASSQYLTYGTDEMQHDVIGTETHISANERGLTIGGWFKFTSVPASIMGLISKWEQTIGNERAYRLYKSAANNIVFQVSNTGADSFTVTSAGTVTTNTWYHIYGRFDPSVEIAVFLDNVKTSNIVAIPASVFNSDEPLEIGRTDRGNYLDGKASMCQLNAAYLSDSIVSLLWEQSRVMYSREG